MMTSHSIAFPVSNTAPVFGFGFASASAIPPAALLSPISRSSEQRKRRISDDSMAFRNKKVRSVSPGPELSEAVEAVSLEGSILVEDALDGQSNSTLLNIIKQLTEKHPGLCREVIRMIPPTSHVCQLDRIDSLEKDLIRNIPRGSRTDYVLSSLRQHLATYERHVIKLLRTDMTELTPFTLAERLTSSYLRLIVSCCDLRLPLKTIWENLKRAWEFWISSAVVVGMVGTLELGIWSRGLQRLIELASSAAEGEEYALLQMLEHEFCRRTGMSASKATAVV